MPDKSEEIKKHFLSILKCACGKSEAYQNKNSKNYEVFEGYDSREFSAYKLALEFAVKLGWIKKEEVFR